MKASNNVMLDVMYRFKVQNNLYHLAIVHIKCMSFKIKFTFIYSKTPLLRPPLCLRKNGLYSGVGGLNIELR